MSQRLLHIVSSLDYCGATRQLALLAPALRELGHESRVLSLNGNGPMSQELADAGVPVEWVYLNSHHLPRGVRQMQHKIRSYHPDVIHTWSPRANRIGRLASIFAGIPSIIASVRTESERPAFLQRIVDQQLDKRSCRVVFNSSLAQDSHDARERTARIEQFIPNAVRMPTEMESRDRERWSKQWRIPANAKWIATVGPLLPTKRVKDLIWAADLLKVVRSDVYLVVFGTGPDRPRLERYREQIQIRDRVIFADDVPRVPELLPMFDCLWHASRWESCPNAVLEAMAAAIPVIGADCEGTRALLADKQHKLLVPIGDRAAFARATLPLLDDHQQCREIGQRLCERVAERHSLTAAVQAYVAMLRTA
jgi:glycosyltransferase involved in cell wall biosynthesis